MPQRAASRAKKQLDYPAETRGSRLAAKARKLASRHTPAQRRAHMDAAMAMVYGGSQPKEAARTGR